MLNVIKSNLSPSMLGTKVNFSRLLLVLILAPIFSFTGIAASSAAITPVTFPVSTIDGITITSLSTYLNEPNSTNGLVFRMTAPTPPTGKAYAFYKYINGATNYKDINSFTYLRLNSMDNEIVMSPIANSSYVQGFTYNNILIFEVDKIDANNVCSDLNTCTHTLIGSIGTPPLTFASTTPEADIFTEKVVYDYYINGVLMQSRIGPKDGPVLPYTGSGTPNNVCVKKINDFGTYTTLKSQICTTPLVATPDSFDKGLDADGSCGFSLTNPTSWVKCIFVPTDLNTPVQRMKKSFDATFLGTATGVVSDLFSPFKQWVSSTKPPCQGYGVTLPVHLFGQGRADMLVYPMSTCAPIIQQYLPYVLNIMSSFLFLGTLFVLLRILFGAFGLKFDLFKSGE